MSECSLISQPLIPLSASGVASKPLSVYAGHTFGIDAVNLQARYYTNLQFCQMMYISLIVCLFKSLQRLLETTAQRYAKLEHLRFTR